MATREEERRRQGLAGTLTPPTGPNPSRRLSDFVPSAGMAPNMAARQPAQQNLVSVYGSGQPERQTRFQRLRNAPISQILGEAFNYYAQPAIEGVQAQGDRMRTSRQQQAQQQAQQARQSFMQQQAVPGQQSMALRQPPQDRTTEAFAGTATGRDANPPSLGQRSLANQRLGGADITQGPAGFQRQVFGDERARYIGPGGSAEFQGTPREQGMSVFGGARTDAAAQRSLADYRAQGLDQFGNDMQGIGQLNQTADRMRAANQEQLSSLRASREANAREAELGGLRSAIQRAGFSDVADDQRAGAAAERRLAQLGDTAPQQDLYATQQGLALQRQGLQQQGAQAQAQGAAAAQQQGIDNRINFERLGLDQAEFNRQIEQDGKLDRVEWGAQIAETYDPFNAPKDADGNPVDRQTYVQQTLNDILAGTGVVAGPDGTIYNAAEIQALADRDFGGDVEATKNDMRAQGFLGV